MNMLKNILYIFRVTDTRIGKVALGEIVHGMFLAAPTGILLLIIWELFKDQPDPQKIWTKVIIMTVMFVIQLWIAQRVMINTQSTIFTMTAKLRLMLGDHLQKLSLGFYKKRDPGDLASVVLQDVSNFESIFSHSFQSILGAIFGTLFLSIFLFLLDWKLALLMLSAIPFACLFVFIATKAGAKFSQNHIASRNETSSRFIEYMQGIQHLKAFNLTGDRFSTLKTAFNDLRENSIKVEAVFGPFVITSFVVFEFFFLLMVSVGIARINDTSGATIAIPVLVAFLIVGYRLYAPLQLLMADYAILNYMNLGFRLLTVPV